MGGSITERVPCYLCQGPLFSIATAYRDEVFATTTSAAKPDPAAAVIDGIFTTASPATAASHDWVIKTATEAGTTAATGSEGIFTTATTANSATAANSDWVITTATAAGSVEIFTTATAGQDWDFTTVTTTICDCISTTATAAACHHWVSAAAAGCHWVLATTAAEAAGPTTTAAS